MNNAAHPKPLVRRWCGRVVVFTPVAAWVLALAIGFGVPGSAVAASKKSKDKDAPAAATGVAAAPAPPNWSHPAGLQSAPFTLTLSSSLAGARIRFTTDGSAPDAAQGTPYTGPIPIQRTTALRAVVIGSNGVPSEIAARSFLFPADLPRQSGEGFPEAWGIREGQPVRPHYGMNAAAIADEGGPDVVERALRALPVISIQSSQADLFDTARGIYANPMQNGSDWERPASVEMIDPSGTAGFQSGCGLRIQGGWNRRPEECPKHSLRLVFRRKYGAASLHAPVFGAGVQEFDELVLRGGCNNTWLHWSAEERRRGDYLRDQWMRDTYREMGHLSARGRFVHVYLNGLYWGIYNLVERPAGHFLAAHLGGRPADYDARNADRVLEGDARAWDALLQAANAGVRTDEALAAVGSLLDVPAFIDYMLLNLYGANADYDRSSNWYAARRRDAAGRFVFLVWDGERTLESATNNAIAYDDDQSPLRLFQKLREHPDFRRRFATRAAQVLGPSGPLSPAAAGARFQALAQALEPALVLESARWGSYRKDVHPYKVGPYESYTLREHWRPEIARMLREFFPARTGLFASQLRDVDLLPAAP